MMELKNFHHFLAQLPPARICRVILPSRSIFEVLSPHCFAENAKTCDRLGWHILTGQAKMIDGNLNLTFHQGQPEESYEVELSNGLLVWKTNSDAGLTRIELKK